MSDLIKPIDTELTENWVALKPGNYEKGELEEGKSYNNQNLWNFDAMRYPFGIGDEQSAVFIYKQGTIEIHGNVWCYNRLLKPGVYSKWEKIRFLTGEEVIPRDIYHDGVKAKHMNWYKSHILGNSKPKYITVQQHDNVTVDQYKYVSFNEQITTANGDKVYPIPVLDGTITIYPDGSFKTTHAVIKSDDYVLLDGYGSLGEQDQYGLLHTLFDGVEKDDNNPFNVYKLISNNEDGSITYGAIDANKELDTNVRPICPIGLIPINDGEVTINHNGEVTIKGLVVNDKGIPIRPGKFKHSDIIAGVQKTGDKSNMDDLIYDENYLDYGNYYFAGMGTARYVPSYNGNRFVDLDTSTFHYRYYPDESSIVKNTEYLDGVKYHTFTFKAMPKWDSFILENRYSSDNRFIPDANDYVDIVDDNVIDFDENGNIISPPEIDKKQLRSYPIATPHYIALGNKYIYPRPRYDLDGEIRTLNIIDHRLQYNDIDFKPFLKPLSWFDTDDNQVSWLDDNMFIPYLTRNINDNNNSRVILHVNGDNKELEVIGNVIWKRGKHYYKLKPGRVKFDLSWPDVVDESGNFISLFSVNGYFTDEPIFIRKDGGDMTRLEMGDRQEEGVFKLVDRDVTTYLTPYQKKLLDSIVGNAWKWVEKETKDGFIEKRGLSHNRALTAIDVNIALEYHAWNPREFVTWYLHFSPISERGVGYNKKGFDVSRNRAKRMFDTLIHYDPDNVKLSLNTTNNTDVEELHVHLPEPFAPFFNYQNGLINPSLSLTSNYQEGVMNKKVFKMFNEPRIIRNTILNRQGGAAYRIYSNLNNLGYEAKYYQNTLGANHVYNTGRQTPFTTIVNGEPIYHKEPQILDLPERFITKNDDGSLKPLRLNLKDGLGVTKFYYHLSTDTKLITGELSSSDRELYLDLGEHDYGYVEIWYDDPFEQERATKRVELKATNKLKPITISYPKLITSNAMFLAGAGEPNATLTLSFINPFSLDDVLVDEVKINKEGIWRINNPVLYTGIKYLLVATNEYGESATLDFGVSRDFYKSGDTILNRHLFNKDIYLYPISLVYHTASNLNITPINSKITWDINNQTYTLSGIIVDDDYNLYEEGTYPIGTVPPSYQSEIIPGKIDASYTGNTLTPVFNDIPIGKGYVVGGEYRWDTNRDNKNEFLLTDSSASYQRVEKWQIPKVWWDKFIELVNHRGKTNNDKKQMVLNHLVRYGLFDGIQVKPYTNKISRNGDLIVFENPYCLYLPILNTYISLDHSASRVNGRNGTAYAIDYHDLTNRYLGESPEMFIDNLVLDVPWFLRDKYILHADQLYLKSRTGNNMLPTYLATIINKDTEMLFVKVRVVDFDDKVALRNTIALNENSRFFISKNNHMSSYLYMDNTYSASKPSELSIYSIDNWYDLPNYNDGSYRPETDINKVIEINYNILHEL